jgi:hypothetical protein
MKLLRDVVSFVLLLAMVVSLSLASTFLSLSVPELIQSADGGIFIGRVLKSTSVWNEDHTMIWTEINVLILEDLSNMAAEGKTQVFRVPGGRIEGAEIRMQGAPEFVIGDKVLLFSTFWPDGTRKVLGYFQGKSSIRKSPDGRDLLKGGKADSMTLEELRLMVSKNLRMGGTK